MAFSKKIADKALIACERRCCLCHKYCGIKMELHHIIQVADGGKDTFDNCIPLCLECHAEVKSYNKKHPKGRPYSESEIKGHRDNWYRKVENSGGSTASDQYISMDKQMYAQINNVIPPDGSIQTIKNHNFSYSFNRGILAEIRKFLDLCEKPNFEFMDSDLEGMKSALRKAILIFDNYLARNTWTLKGNIGCSQVPEEWETEQPERYESTIAEIHKRSENVWKSYSDLIKMCRRKLGVY